MIKFKKIIKIINYFYTKQKDTKVIFMRNNITFYKNVNICKK